MGAATDTSPQAMNGLQTRCSSWPLLRPGRAHSGGGARSRRINREHARSGVSVWQLVILTCALVAVVSPLGLLADDTVTIPKSRLQELERKEAELQKLKGGLVSTNPTVPAAQPPAAPPGANQNRQVENPPPSPSPQAPSSPTSRPALAPISPIVSLPSLRAGEVVEASDLALHYLANPAVADTRYLKHTVEVRGEIERFQKSLPTRNYRIVLYTPDRRIMVVCTITPPETFKAVFTVRNGSELVGLTPAEIRVPIAKVGQTVTIRGSCAGLGDGVVKITGAALLAAK